MIKKFRYMTDQKDTHGVSELGLNEGDFFQLIETKISSIKKIRDNFSVYNYYYLIHIPEHNRCFIVGNDDWVDLINHSEYIDWPTLIKSV
jgi:hypothetical protein